MKSTIWRLALILGLLVPILGLSPQVEARAATESPVGGFTLGWNAAAGGPTRAVAWGDVDADGDLDLAVANTCASAAGCGLVQLYQNDAGTMPITPGWAVEAAGSATSLAWGDADGDGDLDLAVGLSDGASRVYRNEGGALGAELWRSPISERTTSLAWGDVDGDGDLDLAVGNSGQPNRIYTNGGGALAAGWVALDSDETRSLAWGDADGDGDLDLAVGNAGASRVYENDGGTIATTAAWSTARSDRTSAIAWGDLDGDGDLDLILGNGGADGRDRAYTNTSPAGAISFAEGWVSAADDLTNSVALGDFDGDGDLDLATGNGGLIGEPNRIYRNEAGALVAAPAWESPEADSTNSVVWGDFDSDGDLDLAAGNGQDQQIQINRIYRNSGSLLEPLPGWEPGDAHEARSLAWGDVDGDGDLDLAVGSFRQAKQLFLNTDGVLSATAAWESQERNRTVSLAWGDVDGDDDLDLAAGNSFEPIQIYLNTNGSLSRTADWRSNEADGITSLAWGDVDGDGDLDLAAGNNAGPSGVYANQGGTLETTASWATAEQGLINSVAWGDVDGDGDLDLAAGNSGGPSRLYRNQGGTLETTAAWVAAETALTFSLAWGDVDGDGDLDLAAGNLGQNWLFENREGTLGDRPAWRSNEADYTLSVAWGDADGDGDLDLAAGNGLFQSSRLYRSEAGALTAGAVWASATGAYTWSAAWGDADGDGDLDLALSDTQRSRLHTNTRSGRRSPTGLPSVAVRRPAPGADAAFYSVAGIQAGQVISFTYTLRDPQSAPVGRVIGQYSLDGGGRWLDVAPSAGTSTRDLASSPEGTSHTFGWDVRQSAAIGLSDNTVFRLLALPDRRPRPTGANGLPPPILGGAATAQTFPFRLRGSQVRVLQDEQPVAGAIVYRLPAGLTRGGLPFADFTGRPFRTDGQGYLQGRSEIRAGDRLVALREITATGAFTLFFTSAAATATGLDAAVVRGPGIQTLRVESRNPLLLLNLDVGLEWDARRDAGFLAQLRYDIQRAAELLYDWSDGQVALGRIRVFQDRQRWDDVHIRVYATNQLRPNANQGGIVGAELADPQVAEVIYGPGQVRMGAIWNRYGESSALGEDWPRALAHELGHFALYLDDNYLGRDAQGRLISIDSCPGAMSDPYRDDYSEFHPDAGWLPACARTLSHLSTGRSDWATISAFYPWLRAPSTTALPATPLQIAAHSLAMRSTTDGYAGFSAFGVTMRGAGAVDAGNPITPGAADLSQAGRTRLYFPLVGRAPEANSGPGVLPLALTTIELVEPAAPAETLDVPIFFLAAAGGPPQAGPNARAVLFPRGQDRLIDLGRPSLDQLITYGARPGDRLCVYDRDYGRAGCEEAIVPGDVQIDLAPLAGWAPDLQITPVTSRTIDLEVREVAAGLALRARLFRSDTLAGASIALTEAGGRYRGRFTLSDPTLEGTIQLWVDEPARPRREAITDFALGGNPGRVRSRDVPRGQNPGRVRSRDAPAISNDGRVILYGDDLSFPEGAFFTIQAATRLPPLPPGRTLVGQGYWLRASPRAPDLRRTAISISYQSRDVAVSEEPGIRVYFWDGQGWQILDTVGDPARNEAAAQTRGPGLYALMASLEVGLEPGWNLVAYPSTATLPVAEALGSIAGAYTTVYGFSGADSADPWAVYDIDAPAWVNDLGRLEPGRGYWINATRPITLYLQSGLAPATLLVGDAGVPTPPMTLYATLGGPAQAATQVGMPVVARVGDRICGRGLIRAVDGRRAFVIDVAGGGCGAPGWAVTIWAGDLPLGETSWDNGRPRGLAVR